MARSVIPEDLKKGLRNFWYPIYRSSELKAKPVGITRLGEKLVLWRDGAGAANLFPDRCGHRGAQLSIGDIVEGRLQCRYHGLQYDGTGQCRLVPVDRQIDGPQAKPIRVTSYPVEERFGLIFAYIGDTEIFPPPLLELDPFITDTTFVSAVSETVWNANWLVIHDNTSDPTHVPFLHGHFAVKLESGGVQFERLSGGNPLVTPEMALGTVTDELVAIRRERGIFTTRKEATGDHSETFDEVEFVLPCEVKVWVPSPGGGGPFRVVQYELPIDEHRTIVYAWIARQCADSERETETQMLETFGVPATEMVYMEDSWITERQPEPAEAWPEENLLSFDVGPIAVRKIIMETYRAQQRKIREYGARTGNGSRARRRAPAEAQRS